jgi:hypothetical protein
MKIGIIAVILISSIAVLSYAGKPDPPNLTEAIQNIQETIDHHDDDMSEYWDNLPLVTPVIDIEIKDMLELHDFNMGTALDSLDTGLLDLNTAVDGLIGTADAVEVLLTDVSARQDDLITDVGLLRETVDATRGELTDVSEGQDGLLTQVDAIETQVDYLFTETYKAMKTETHDEISVWSTSQRYEFRIGNFHNPYLGHVSLTILMTDHDSGEYIEVYADKVSTTVPILTITDPNIVYHVEFDTDEWSLYGYPSIGELSANFVYTYTYAYPEAPP